MIKLEVDNWGLCNVSVEGKVIDLLAELPIGFGTILYRILEDCPVEHRDTLIKGVFECTLDMMKREAEKQ